MAVEFWRMGADPVPCADMGRIARELEESGWDGLAVGEAHGILPDPYAVLSVAAAATTRIKVGTAVAVPLRHPMLAADAMQTVQGVSNGRAHFCIGRGDGAVKVLQEEPMRVAEFERYVGRIQGYLRCEVVQIDGKISSMGRLADIDPSLDIPKPKIDIAATGPRTIALAARTADAISFSVGADPERLHRAKELARQACEDASRPFEELELGCYVQAAVVDDGDTSGRDAIRGVTLTHARFSGFEVRPTAEEVSDTEHREYRHAVETMEKVLRDPRGGVVRKAGGEPGELDFYPQEAASDELIDRFGIVGSAEYCAERLQEIVDLGFKRIWIGTKSVGADLKERNAHRLGREALPLVRR
jgi:5,10-methylenetetrahydromethanopterin reductase